MANLDGATGLRVPANRAPMSVNAAFVLEQHVGHLTYADNLRRAVETQSIVRPRWIPVTYEVSGSGRFSLPSLHPALAGRHQVRKGLASTQADVVVFNTQVPAALGGLHARQAPYIVVTDVTPMQYDAIADGYGHRPDRGPLKWLKHRINASVFQGAAHCVAWSAWAADSIIRDYGVDAARVSVIPPGVDVDRWSPGDHNSAADPMRILFVGGELDRKGGDLLIEACSSTAAPVELTVVTKSDITSSDQVTVVRDLEPNDERLVDLFRRSDVFALPSKAETFGIAALEASACGLALITTGVGGLAEINIADRTGLVVPAGDLSGLTQAIETLAADRELRQSMGQNARQHAVENFDALANAASLLQLVRQLGNEQMDTVS